MAKLYSVYKDFAKQGGIAVKEDLIDVIILIGINTIINITWCCLEIAILGYTNHNKVDSIIGTILTISLYGNLKSWIKKK